MGQYLFCLAGLRQRMGDTPRGIAPSRGHTRRIRMSVRLARCSKWPDFSPAQPRRLLHPPALSLPRQPLRPGTRRSAGKAAAPWLTLVSRFTPHVSRLLGAN